VEPGQAAVAGPGDSLVDASSPFLELSPMAANGIYSDEAPVTSYVPGMSTSRKIVLVIGGKGRAAGMARTDRWSPPEP
jgi:3-methylcrotonyl-CoA carboxylase beta subunit